MKNKRFMFSIFGLILSIVLVVAVPFAALAADVPNAPITLGDFITQAWALIGGMKGASGLAIVTGAVQIVMWFLRTNVLDFAGPIKLVAVAVTTVAFTYLQQVAAGVGWLPALFSSAVIGAVLAAIQVATHQTVKQLSSS